MTHVRLVLLAVSTTLAAALGMTAQTTSPQTTAPQNRTKSRTVTVLPGFGPAGTAIADKPHVPFSGVLVQHWEQALSDGVNITRDNEEVVMRDNVGRIYRGREIKLPQGRQVEPRLMITITDPVEHVQYICNPIKICRKMEYRKPPYMRGPHVTDPKKMPDVTVEDLGPSNISGVEVEGTRVTSLIPEGRVGNDRPFNSVEELWRSRELGLDVQVKRADPRMGTRTTTLTEVHLGEPDPKYFQIPEGYRVYERNDGATGAMSPIQTESDYSFPPMPPGSVPPNQ